MPPVPLLIPARGPYTAANPRSRSAMMSSMCSVPIESLIVLGWIPLLLELGGAQLRVGRGGRMDHEALDVGHVGQQREDLEVVDEPKSLLPAALDVKGEDRASPVGKIPLVKRVVGVVGQARVVDLLHKRVPRQKLHHGLGVLGMAVKTKRERLHALEQQNALNGEMVAPMSRSSMART